MARKRQRVDLLARPSSVSSVEGQIRRAQQEGLFDDLPGKGKPLEDLTEVYDPGWWAAKLVQCEEISLLPPALELERKVERELDRIGKLRRERVTTGPSTTIARLDVDAIVARWHRLQT